MDALSQLSYDPGKVSSCSWQIDDAALLQRDEALVPLFFLHLAQAPSCRGSVRKIMRTKVTLFAGLCAAVAACITACSDTSTATDGGPSDSGMPPSPGDSGFPRPLVPPSPIDSGTDADAGGDASDSAVPPTFTRVWNTILSQQCGGVGACHNRATGSGGLSFNNDKATAYADLVDVNSSSRCGAITKLVTPGAPAQSKLFIKLSSPTRVIPACGNRMPDPGDPPLPAEDLKLIEDWIAGGAQDD